jgi:hypothetical protein
MIDMGCLTDSHSGFIKPTIYQGMYNAISKSPAR